MSPTGAASGSRPEASRVGQKPCFLMWGKRLACRASARDGNRDGCPTDYFRPGVSRWSVPLPKGVVWLDEPSERFVIVPDPNFCV